MEQPIGYLNQELIMERNNLASAEVHIARGERRITAQRLRLERLHAQQANTAPAEELLRQLEGVLRTWGDHRREIMRKIAYLERNIPS